MPFTRLSTFTPSIVAKAINPNSSTSQWRALFTGVIKSPATSPTDTGNVSRSLSPSRGLAQVRSEPFSELWFTASFPAKVGNVSKSTGLLQTTTTSPTPGNDKDHKSPDERTLKLGKTLRKLSPLLPNLLTTTLPQELLSPSVSLHLFPSTHPHLPVVKGRVPFRAALWTAPVAWGSVPLVGNVKLEIVSEKIVRTGFVSAPTLQDESHDGLGEEKLVVRWRTEKKKTNGNKSDQTSSTASMSSAAENGGINRGLSTLLGGTQPIFKSTSNEPFTGLFIFSFDSEGRIASQTIEHADEDRGCDKTSRVVTLTDWLLGKAKWGRVEEGLVPGFAMRRVECRTERAGRRRWDFKD